MSRNFTRFAFTDSVKRVPFWRWQRIAPVVVVNCIEPLTTSRKIGCICLNFPGPPWKKTLTTRTIVYIHIT